MAGNSGSRPGGPSGGRIGRFSLRRLFLALFLLHGQQVRELTEELARRFGYGRAKGVIVTEVAANSPADRAGITPGILIVSVNRRDVTTVEEFNEALQESVETGKVVLLVRNERFAQYVVVNLD